MQPHHHHRNGEAPSPHFHSTVDAQKLRRFNLLALVFRVVTFCFTLASFIFMLSNSHSSSSWYDFDAFRYVLAASGIVSVYSLFEMFASVWEVSRGITLLPEVLQVWFDFSHDQVFAYILMSANSAGLVQARSLKGLDICAATNAFCLQLDIAIALGFIGFLFLGFSTLLSGFRVACFLINGSRCYL